MYKIKLIVDGKNEEFKRTKQPVLEDITKALKVQQHQYRMYQKDDGPTDRDFDKNADNIANFAVDFWGGQFTKADVIKGATSDAMVDISKIIDESLGIKDPNEEEETETPAKK